MRTRQLILPACALLLRFLPSHEKLVEEMLGFSVEPASHKWERKAIVGRCADDGGVTGKLVSLTLVPKDLSPASESSKAWLRCTITSATAIGRARCRRTRDVTTVYGRGPTRENTI